MTFAADTEILIDRLDEELRMVPRPSRALFAKIVGSACTRIPALGKSRKAGAIDRLLDAGAWTDAALAIVEFELPTWKPRRLVYDSGEWLCTLSRALGRGLEIDDMVEARHDVLALAILRAFIEARRRAAAPKPETSAVPPLWPLRGNALCCDNFTAAAGGG